MLAEDKVEEFFAEVERCRSWIEAAIENGGDTHNFKDIVDGIISGTMQFWPSANAAAITEIVKYPNKRVLHIFLAGGKMEEKVNMNEDAIKFAKLNKCDAITIAGRRGWVKVLKEKGYCEMLTTLAKELN